ncbi:hypothetical protein GCM10023205_22250 [Yinghuangia aomiensis]|uniref:Uncharacterized protein n=1 Tax=Yinghuangia aomiensis TaxID=676205 RepID=A0ABP9H0S2_9ACTN
MPLAPSKPLLDMGAEILFPRGAHTSCATGQLPSWQAVEPSRDGTGFRPLAGKVFGRRQRVSNATSRRTWPSARSASVR